MGKSNIYQSVSDYIELNFQSENKMMNKKIRKARRDRELSQKEVSERIGISRKHYNQYETGVAKLSQKYVDKLIAMFSL